MVCLHSMLLNLTPCISYHYEQSMNSMVEAANRLHAAQTATLMSNECWSIRIRCRDSAQEVSQAYNPSVLGINFQKLVSSTVKKKLSKKVMADDSIDDIPISLWQEQRCVVHFFYQRNTNVVECYKIFLKNLR